MSRQCRPYLAQLRNGILPLQLEVGTWINKAVEERLCLICNNGTVEDEEHFLFHCNFYNSERQDFYNYMKNNNPNFNNLSIEQKLQTVMTKEYVQIFMEKEYVQIFMENLRNETEQTICLIMIS